MSKKLIDKAKITASLKHTWKYHKASTLQYCFSLFMFLSALLSGLALIKNNIILDNKILYLLIFVTFSWTVWSVFSSVANSQYSYEQNKEKLPIVGTEEMQKK